MTMSDLEFDRADSEQATGPVLSEQDAEAEAKRLVLEAYGEIDTREAHQVAVVEMPRFPMPKRDAEGHLVRENGRLIVGPMELFFVRVSKETQRDVAKRFQRWEAHRDESTGRMVSEKVLDGVPYAEELIYLSLKPWCRALYFDDKNAWGTAPVGTGREYMAWRLNTREKEACSQAIEALEGYGENQARNLGKR